MSHTDDPRGSEEECLTLKPIGTIRTPFHVAEGTPIQPIFGSGVDAVVEIDEEYSAALADIEGFERVWLLYWLDRAGPFAPRVVPYRDCVERGLFATRSPARPNPIGISVVRLVERRGAVLRVTDIDILDGTALLDIKPYVPAFDSHPGSRAGWFDATADGRTVADGRFHHAESDDPKPPR
jgi:tRNA-Thr(GGU) m(6)t(6)A37 methyltransferase TsaA